MCERPCSSPSNASPGQIRHRWLRGRRQCWNNGGEKLLSRLLGEERGHEGKWGLPSPRYTTPAPSRKVLGLFTRKSEVAGTDENTTFFLLKCICAGETSNSREKPSSRVTKWVCNRHRLSIRLLKSMSKAKSLVSKVQERGGMPQEINTYLEWRSQTRDSKAAMGLLAR